MRRAIIFGATGQDGSYLIEYLLSKNYYVIGVKRRSSSINTQRLTDLINSGDERFLLVHGDVTDTSSVFSIISKYKPDEIYNLAAQSHVGVSFNEPEYTSQVDAIGTLRLLEACRQLCPSALFYQASTSELYGGLLNIKLNEQTPFNPRSPYAAAKLYSFYLVRQYRDGYGLRAYNGILFNHESPRRGENFVSRKITLQLGKILKGEVAFIELGNLNSIRDWGHAKDYVVAMHTMMELAIPGDYVVATGNCFSVKEFCIEAFAVIGHKIEFRGIDVEEIGVIVGYDDANIISKKIQIGTTVIKVSKKYFRPLEVPHLLGDASKFIGITNWTPNYKFKDIVREMVLNDI
jgi:GDPmannose 4,6-dehydratase